MIMYSCVYGFKSFDSIPSKNSNIGHICFPFSLIQLLREESTVWLRLDTHWLVDDSFDLSVYLVALHLKALLLLPEFIRYIKMLLLINYCVR